MFGLFAKDPDRSTSGAWVPADTRVYAIGDIHGRLDLLERLLGLIRKNAAGSDAARKIIVYLGDYVDRGPDSAGIVDLLIEGPLPGFESVHLIGNHESFLLEFLDDLQVLNSWIINGGDATLRSFGVDAFDAPEGVNRARWLQEEFRAALSETQLDFLKSLKVSHLEGDYLFVHAGIRPGVPIEEQDPFDLLWIREPFLSSDEDFGKIVVHGHTPSSQPVRKRNRIGIDTGAVYGGELTALVLEGQSQRFLHV